MSSLLTLSSLVGISSIKLSTGLSASWEPFAIFSNVDGLPGPQRKTSTPSNNKTFITAFDIASVPFFIACCIRVNITKLPQETCCIKLKHGTELRKAMVRFTEASDFQVCLSPILEACPNQDKVPVVSSETNVSVPSTLAPSNAAWASTRNNESSV